MRMKKTGSPQKTVDQVVKKIREKRLEKSLSYDGLAMLADLNKSTIGMVETRRNSPTLLTCIKLCDALDMRLSELLREVGK